MEELKNWMYEETDVNDNGDIMLEDSAMSGNLIQSDEDTMAMYSQFDGATDYTDLSFDISDESTHSFALNGVQYPLHPGDDSYQFTDFTNSVVDQPFVLASQYHSQNLNTNFMH